MTTITLSNVKKKLMDQSLHFNDIKELLEFLRDEWYITEFWLADVISSKAQKQYDRNTNLDKSLFIDVTNL